MSVSEAIVLLGDAVKPYLEPYRDSNHKYVRMALKFLRNKGMYLSDSL
jgi:hypothetical protein